MSQQVDRSRWIIRAKPRAEARLRLLCFPYAGGGASLFRTWWQYLPEEADVAAVQLPGREDQYRQRPFRRMTELTKTLAQVLAPFFSIPFAFFGHSMGGLVAFELTRQLRGMGGPLPVGLFVSGRRAPQLAEPLSAIHHLPDDELAGELQRRYGGMPQIIAEDAELRAIFLPTVRADLELVDTHLYRAEPPLGCPITVFGGLEDTLSRDDLAAWQQQTTAPLELHMLPGDHFFLDAQRPTLLGLVADRLRRYFS